MKTALVTGCSRGIGREITRALLADGWCVYGLSRTFPEGGEAWPTDRFVWLRCDLGRQGLALRLYELMHSIERLDAVVHAAAIRGPSGPFWECPLPEWLETIRVNLLGTYHVVETALPRLRHARDGRILLFSGGGAFGPSPGYSAYAVAKAGVVSLMETTAAELRGSTVTINCVAPGPVPTTIHGANPLPDDGGAAMATAVACVRHLLSPAAYGVSGKTIAAQHDDWESISPETVGALNASVLGTRSRHLIDRLVERARNLGRVSA